MAVLIRTWHENFAVQKATVIFGGVNTKQTAAILRILQVIAEKFIFVRVKSQRGLSVEELSAFWNEVAGARDIPVETAESVAAAIESARRETGPILITGSLYLAGDALAELESTLEFEVSEQ
jgi:dihydrofolate synthase/folylpolyglutamate synthase